MRRRDKQAQQSTQHMLPPVFQEKLLPLQPLTAQNPKQGVYIDAIRSKYISLVVATGYAGTSKTYIPSRIAAELFLEGKIKKIVICRPAMSNSKSLGFFSGDKDEKMMNWVMPVLDTIQKVLGASRVKYEIKIGRIELLPMEVAKGRSFDPDTFIICDEAEDLTIDEVKTILTRNAGCKMVLSGDTRQSALKERSGLKVLADLLKKEKEIRKYVKMVDFGDYDDIVRHEVCKLMIMVFDRNNL